MSLLRPALEMWPLVFVLLPDVSLHCLRPPLATPQFRLLRNIVLDVPGIFPGRRRCRIHSCDQLRTSSLLHLFFLRKKAVRVLYNVQFIQLLLLIQRFSHNVLRLHTGSQKIPEETELMIMKLVDNWFRALESTDELFQKRQHGKVEMCHEKCFFYFSHRGHGELFSPSWYCHHLSSSSETQVAGSLKFSSLFLGSLSAPFIWQPHLLSI